VQYRIFPAIGMARLGDSDEMFACPEVIGSRGRELDGSEVASFKDAAFRVRKQAARFHVFQRADANAPWVRLSDGVVEWTVRLANKKDAITRPGIPIDPKLTNPTKLIRPVLDPARANRLMSAQGTIRSDAGTRAIQDLTGHHVTKGVKLGQLRVDGQGRLLVIGGDIDSGADPVNSPIGSSFYDNPGWYDDVADGPVSATVTLPGADSVPVDPAWCIVAPPDFAPGADPIVTLFDKILQVAIDQNLGGPWTQVPGTPSFTHDIQPILRRARSLGWVHIDSVSGSGQVTNQKNWTKISQDFVALNTNGTAGQPLRSASRDHVMQVEHLLSDYQVTSRQRNFLEKWVGNTFADDWVGVPEVTTDPTAESLTRSALEGAVGQGFFPGIEGGRILADPSIYLKPFDFRIDPSVLSAGDVTALMAQPWQADFLKCAGNWWPSQRPDIAPQADGSFLLWQRPLDDSSHARLVTMVKRFGMITVQTDAAGVQVSATGEGRDPTLPTV
jgi:hypothetical protein